MFGDNNISLSTFSIIFICCAFIVVISQNVSGYRFGLIGTLSWLVVIV